MPALAHESTDPLPNLDVLRAHAQRLLAALVLNDGEPERLTHELTLGARRIKVEVRPAGELPDWLTPCMIDIIDVLRGQRGRMTTTYLMAAMDRADMLHGESTIKLALATLAKAGVISSQRVAPSGYCLTEAFANARPAKLQRQETLSII